MTMHIHGQKGFGAEHFNGLVKVKLIHTEGTSIIIPDQIFLEEPMVWFQPTTFLPSILVKDEGTIHGTLHCDITGGHTLRVYIENSGLIEHFPDNSFLYRCTIEGAMDIVASSSGEWSFIKGRPFLRLYHHTSKAASESILSSKVFKPSAWNIQGTRTLKETGYVYFTAIKKIRNAMDLAAIAMSPNRKLHFLRDGAQPPPSYPPSNWQQTDLANDLLEIEVYWSTPDQRNKTVSFNIDSTIIASPHVFCHTDYMVWYEIACPAIQRVGIALDALLEIEENEQISDQGSVRRFGYIVIGDATMLDGLAAPFDEENTMHKFKIHETGEPPLEFWFKNANSDQYDRISVIEQEFAKGEDKDS